MYTKVAVVVGVKGVVEGGGCWRGQGVGGGWDFLVPFDRPVAKTLAASFEIVTHLALSSCWCMLGGYLLGFE